VLFRRPVSRFVAILPPTEIWIGIGHAGLPSPPSHENSPERYCRGNCKRIYLSAPPEALPSLPGALTHLSLSRLNHRLPGREAHPEGVQGTADVHHDIGSCPCSLPIRLILDSRVVLGQVCRNSLFLQALRGSRDRCGSFEKSLLISMA
jgi:hypothetical protein